MTATVRIVARVPRIVRLVSPAVAKAEAGKRGIMLALSIPADVAKLIALDSGEAADALHCTVAYMGREDDLPADAAERVLAAAQEVAAKFGPVSGWIGGIGRFNASRSSDGKDVLHAMLDAPVLPALRAALVDALDERRIGPKREHGYSPHVTLRYEDAVNGAPLPRIPTVPVVFPALTLSIGDERTEIPLSGERMFKSDIDDGVAAVGQRLQELLGLSARVRAPKRTPTSIAKSDATLDDLAAQVDALWPECDAAMLKATAVQSLIFDRVRFDRDDVIAWLEEHDFAHDKPLDETPESYRARQREPGEFVEGSLRTIDFTAGVQAVVGRLPEGVEATAVEKARARRSASYLEAVLDMARKQLPGWLWRQVHAAAFPSSGGRARAAARDGTAKVSLNVAKSTATRLACSADDKRLIYAVFMEPDEVDAHGEKASREAIELACHGFMANGGTVNVEHNGPDVDAQVVENYIAPVDMAFGSPPQPVRAGSWLGVIKVRSDDLWARAKAGEFGGVSVEGLAVRNAAP